jgi:hypothetical protein
MKSSERRRLYKEELAKRTQESYANRDSMGKFKSIFEPSKMQGVPRWKPAEDDHSINIIPYIAGKNNPLYKEGKIAYYLDIYIHRAIGVNEDSFICLNRSYGQKCPICDHIAELKKTDDYDEDYVKSLNPTRRAIYNIQVLDNPKEIAKGIQLWDVSHFLFEKELAELAKKKQGGGYVNFSDPDEGKIISFRKKGEGKSTKYPALSFEERDEPISDELLDNAKVLEDLLHIPTYDEVYDAFFGTPAKAADDDRPVAKAKDEDDVPPEVADELVCPIDQEIGVEFDNFDNCDNCKIRKFCQDVSIQLKDEAAQRAEEEAKAKAAAEKQTPIPRTRTRAEVKEEPAPPTPIRRRVR